MGQVKIYGLDTNIDDNRDKISDVIHFCIVEALKYPKNKKFHRFIKLSKEDFIYSDDRSNKYIIIEIIMFEGRTVESKKNLINLLFKNLEEKVGINNNDVEITIFEIPKCNWGIRGFTGDDLSLNYKVEV